MYFQSLVHCYFIVGRFAIYAAGRAYSIKKTREQPDDELKLCTLLLLLLLSSSSLSSSNFSLLSFGWEIFT